MTFQPNADLAVDPLARQAAAHVNPDRLHAALEALARFGGRDDGGVSRQTLTDIDLASRRHLIEQARALGCSVSIDACANLYFRRAGTHDLPAIMTGSHADTQPIGGTLDGAYGVVAGLEVVAALNDAGIQTRHPIEVVSWTNEEGCRFAPGAMGSSAYVDPSRLPAYRDGVDSAGIRCGDELDRALEQAADVDRRPMAGPLAAYVELHIEQGPVLEQARTPLAVVQGIQGVRWYRVTCNGQAAHAGTTPMSDRRDAVVAALGLGQQLHALAEASDNRLRVTMGSWAVEPNSVNTIAATVVFTVDARSPDDTVLDGFEQQLHTLAGQWPWQGNIGIEAFFQQPPTRFPDDLLAVLARACEDVSASAGAPAPLWLTSGAFHDAMYLAQHCPSAMLFVPSIDGISHNAAEATDPADLTLGARALAQAVTALAL